MQLPRQPAFCCGQRFLSILEKVLMPMTGLKALALSALKHCDLL